MRWPKPIKIGLAFRLPLWWDAWNTGLILRMQTGDTWNGKIISRKIWTLNDWLLVYERSLLLLAEGAQLDVSDIVRFPDRLDPWRFGWGEDVAELQDQVWRAAQQARRQAPDWDGYALYQRDGRMA